MADFVEQIIDALRSNSLKDKFNRDRKIHNLFQMDTRYFLKIQSFKVKVVIIYFNW